MSSFEAKKRRVSFLPNMSARKSAKVSGVSTSKGKLASTFTAGVYEAAINMTVLKQVARGGDNNRVLLNLVGCKEFCIQLVVVRYLLFALNSGVVLSALRETFTGWMKMEHIKRQMKPDEHFHIDRWLKHSVRTERQEAFFHFCSFVKRKLYVM